MADIWVADKERTKILRFPILPKEFPSIQRAAKNEEFETFNNGNFNFIGNVGLTTFTLEGFMNDTKRKYHFCKSDVIFDDFYFLCKDAMYNKTPIRVILVKDNNTDEFNGLVTVESFSWVLNKNLDYNYNVSFKEFREIEFNNLGVW